MTKKPSYRFAGYTESWEEKKLGEVAEVNPKSVVPDEFKYVDLGAVVGTEMVSYRNETISTSPSRAQRLAVKGDVFYQTVRPYQKNNYLFRKDDNDYVFSTGYAQLRPNGDGCFLLSYLQTNKFVNVVLDNCTGTSYPAINSKDLSNIFISLPSLPEQTAIGSFFQDIDQLISLQQRKLEVLKEQKKTYLKLLFPAKGQTKPALRFAGFEDDWKEVKLGEVLKKNNKKNRDLAINNVESVSNKLGFVKQTEQFEDYSVASADLSNYYVISEKQFAYNPSRINVGSIAYKKEGDTLSVVSPLYISFSTVENIDDSYLWYWFKTSLFDSQREIYSEGGVRDTLSFNQLSNIELIFPFLPEQEAIGSFFQDLDKSIAKQEEKVNQLKESKQTLLRKMFI
ncbi:restriction endonuclease subunit S [Streptococcus mitis]|uniref:restriction endonuclease subunit S n=1 Tax=Streptococcus mitis TaxID=28037 RepID=UPI00069F6C7E|nr:restriction endonuclease subunit S [Streptococcus mitis]